MNNESQWSARGQGKFGNDPNTKEFEKAHLASDVDQSDESIHHTIGDGVFQAARGKNLLDLTNDFDDLISLFSGLTLWTSFTPVILNGPNFVGGRCAYARIGKLVVGRIEGVTGAITGNMGLTYTNLPTPVTGTWETAFGIFSALKTGVTRDNALMVGNAGIFLRTMVQNAGWAPGSPWVWGNDTTIGGFFFYESA
jgi:hypothetical protein